MAKGHWLDPLARSLLAAMGQLPPGEQRPAPHPASEDAERIERELLGLKLRQNPGLRLGSALGRRALQEDPYVHPVGDSTLPDA